MASATPQQQMNPLVKFYRQTRGELLKVTWPTREEAWRLTWIVIVITAAFAVFLGLLDFGFSSLVNWFINFVVGS